MPKSVERKRFEEEKNNAFFTPQTLFRHVYIFIIFIFFFFLHVTISMSDEIDDEPFRCADKKNNWRYPGTRSFLRCWDFCMLEKVRNTFNSNLHTFVHKKNTDRMLGEYFVCRLRQLIIGSRPMSNT